MICNAKPYEGNDAFLFVSYARKDAGIVYPLIERLASAGVRLWYDAGLQGGEIWPEVIADHLNRSAACLAFVSRNAVASHNCFHELIFAVESRKSLIPIRYNGAELTLGMRMMIGAVQWLEIAELPTDADISRILALDLIKPMHGIPDRSIALQDYCLNETATKEKSVKWRPESIAPQLEEQVTQPEPPKQQGSGPESTSEQWMQSVLQNQATEEDKPAEQSAIEMGNQEKETKVESSDISVYQRSQEQKQNPQNMMLMDWVKKQETQATDNVKETAREEALTSDNNCYRRRTNRRVSTGVIDTEQNEKTVAEDFILDRTVAGDEDLDKTIAAPKEIPPTIVLITGGGKKYRGNIGATVLGRSKNKADIVIPDPERKVSGEHVRITSLEGIHFVEDIHSTNGTWLDGTPLPAEEKRQVEFFCDLMLFHTHVVVAFDKAASTLWHANTLLALRCDETGEIKYLWQGVLTLGRDTPWKEGILADKRVSHTHVSFRIVENQCIVRDENSTNGTILNSEKMTCGEERTIQTGDIIQVGTWHFIATVIDLSGGKEE